MLSSLVKCLGWGNTVSALLQRLFLCRETGVKAGDSAREQNKAA